MKLLSQKKYEELIHELATNEHRIFDLNKRLDKKQQELLNEKRIKETLQEASETISNEKLKLLNKVKQLKDNLRKSNGSIGGLTKEKLKLKAKIKDLENENNLLKETKNKLFDTYKYSLEENSKLKKEIEKVTLEKSKLQSSVVQLNEKNKVLTSKKSAKKYLRREERNNKK